VSCHAAEQRPDRPPDREPRGGTCELAPNRHCAPTPSLVAFPRA
jgi:hypothetical protein